MKKNNKIKNKYYDFYSLFLNITNDFKWNRHISDNFLAISLKLLRHENQTSIKLSIIILIFLLCEKSIEKNVCVYLIFCFCLAGEDQRLVDSESSESNSSARLLAVSLILITQRCITIFYPKYQTFHPAHFYL